MAKYLCRKHSSPHISHHYNKSIQAKG